MTGKEGRRREKRQTGRGEDGWIKRVREKLGKRGESEGRQRQGEDEGRVKRVREKWERGGGGEQGPERERGRGREGEIKSVREKWEGEEKAREERETGR